MATCSFDGCNCDNYREELVGAAHLVLDGNCINCQHPANQHPRRPASKLINFIIEIILSTYKFSRYRRCRCCQKWWFVCLSWNKYQCFCWALVYVCVCLWFSSDIFSGDGFWQFFTSQFSSCFFGPRCSKLNVNGKSLLKKPQIGFCTNKLPHSHIAGDRTSSRQSLELSVSAQSKDVYDDNNNQTMRRRTRATT